MGLVVGEGVIFCPNESQNLTMECERARGENKHPTIKDCVRKAKASLVIIQETKLE